MRNVLFVLLLILVCMTLSARSVAVHAAITAQETPPTALRITEIMYNPPAQGGIDGRDLEFIELHNDGPTPFTLDGLRFSAGIDYRFPAGAILQPGAYLTLASSTAGFTAKYGASPFDAYDGQLDNGGELLRLEDNAGQVVIAQPFGDDASWPCGPDGGDFSLVLVDGARPAAGASWRSSSAAGGSPGFVDPPPPPATAELVISEILAHTDLPDEDAVELYNPTAYDAHVGGWFLSDDPFAPQRYKIPEGLYVPAGGYLVLTESQFGAGDAGFGFSENGESAVITAATCQGETTGYRHARDFGPSPNGVSLGRYATSTGAIHFPLLSRPTLGAENAAPQVGPLVISRIMYHPGVTSAIEDEYIELQNIGSEPVDLYLDASPWLTWRLRGAVRYEFPAGTTLATGARVLVVPELPTTFRARHSIPDDVTIFGPYEGALNNSGERLALVMPASPDLTGPQVYYEVDAVTYDDEAPWPTQADGQGPPLVRIDVAGYGDDPANWRVEDGLTERLYLPLIAADSPLE